MSFIETFNAADAPATRTEFAPVPAGWYLSTIHSAEVKATKAGNGQYIKVRYDLVGGEHAGRVVFANLNTRNSSEKAQEIGRQQLGEIMRCIGLATIQDTDQLVGGTLEIKLSVRDDPQWGVSNEVKGFRASNHSAPAAAAPKVAANAPWK
jgi:Protein of unknown function (DUF669)